MKVFGVMGLLLTFSVMILIDMPKLNAAANKKKYAVIYYAVVGLTILLGMLKIFQVIPDYDKNLALFFQKITGIQ